MDGTTTYSCNTLVAGLILQSTPVDWWCLYWIHGDMDPSVYTRPIHEVPTYAHWPNSHFPHGWCTIMCPPYTLSINILSIFPHPGTATHVPNPVTSPHLDAVAHLITHILE